MPAPTRTVRTYLGLGANLGDADGTLAWAVRALAATAGWRVRAVSPLYATAPWGVLDQPEFRNAVVAVDVRVPADQAADAAALEVLARCKTLERVAGRDRGERWGPRVLDLDLLVFGRHVVSVDRTASTRSLDADADPRKAAKRLEIPHRDLGERRFVLAPLADLAPRLVPPGWSETVGSRRDAVAATEPAEAVRRIATWDPATADWRPDQRR